MYRQFGGGGARRQCAMARPTTVKTLPRIVGVAGGRDEERRIEGERRREDEGNQKSKPSRMLPSWRGGQRQKAKTNTKWKGDTTQSREGGRCPAENAYQKKNKTCIMKERRQNILSYATVSSQVPLAAPRLGVEEGVGRTTKKRTRKTCSPVPLFSGPITQTIAPY